MYGWNALCWKKIERVVCKLQTRIYRAQRRGDGKTVRKLQRLLMKSRSAKLLAVRRVTQDNRGKQTAGVDGVKSLSPDERLELADTLNLNSQAKPVRRVRIPKPGIQETRPLGIPTLHDRALQAVVKLALEPQGEPLRASQLWIQTGALHVGCDWSHLCPHQPESQMGVGCRHNQMLRPPQP